MVIEQLVQFGVAGLMGVLWVWERMHSRRTERQLAEAHEHLIRRDHHVGVLIRLVRLNTQAMTELQLGQRRMNELLEGIQREMAHDDHAA
jgi:hypothetical protein